VAAGSCVSLLAFTTANLVASGSLVSLLESLESLVSEIRSPLAVGYGRVPPTFNLPEGKKVAVNL
jgi:hypothetical protein